MDKAPANANYIIYLMHLARELL